jgi:hypothetical protein
MWVWQLWDLFLEFERRYNQSIVSRGAFRLASHVLYIQTHIKAPFQIDVTATLWICLELLLR